MRKASCWFAMCSALAILNGDADHSFCWDFVLQMPAWGRGLQGYKLSDIWRGAVAANNVLDELYWCTPIDIGQDEDIRITGDERISRCNEACLRDLSVSKRSRRLSYCV